jgi:hypothetical protein
MTLPPAPDRWTIELSNAERMEAVAAFGFTERQARFLLNVLLHSGVFVERQYCAFAGIVHGQKTHDFLRRLVDRGYVTVITPGALHRGRLIHVHYKPLYEAIGQGNSRQRRPASLGG